MQKIIMLPHLPGIKTALFTWRILMINQTIAPIGGIKSGDGRPQAYLWHEGIRGRKDEDVASVMVKFLSSTTVREYNDVTIWCDNCSGQNRNWTLFSSIVHLLADGESDCMLNTVTLKFFEKGQTHSIMLSKMKSGSKNVCMISMTLLNALKIVELLC